MSPFDRILKTMLNPWVSMSYLGLTVLSFFYFDKPIAYFFNALDLKSKLPWLNSVSQLNINVISVAVLFLVVIFFRYVHRNKVWEARSLFLWLCALISSVICGVLKIILGRARPELLFDDQLYGFYGLQLKSQFWSFPSGHTTSIMGLIFGLCVVFPRHCYAFILTGLLLVSTRVILSCHFFSDVMATTFLTLLEVGFILFLLRRKAWLASIYKPMLYAV